MDHRSPAPVAAPATMMIFDTDCVLCNAAVRFILRHERDDAIRFVGAWSKSGLALAADHGFTREDLDRTFLVIAGGECHAESDAAIEIAGHLKAPWSWLGVTRFLPRLLRDGAYRFVARRRYEWFGHSNACLVPAPEEAHRFTYR